MEIYSVNNKKKKKALKKIIKTNVKSTKGFVKFCYGLTWFLEVLAIILGIANILYVIFVSDYMVDIALLMVTFGVPYVLSFLPKTVYTIVLGKEYRFRRKETLTIIENGFIYAYHDGRSNVVTERFSYNVFFKNITKVEYDKETYIITLYGSIMEDIFHGSVLKETNEWGKISFLNVYDIDMKKVLKENVK